MLGVEPYEAEVVQRTQEQSQCSLICRATFEKCTGDSGMELERMYFKISFLLL